VWQFVTSKEYTWIPMKLPAIASNKRKLSPISCHGKSSFNLFMKKLKTAELRKRPFVKAATTKNVAT
jgi:hypothetical protein